MMNAEPGVVQLGQLETQHGSGSPAAATVLGISDFRKCSWRRQEVIKFEPNMFGRPVLATAKNAKRPEAKQLGVGLKCVIF